MTIKDIRTAIEQNPDFVEFPADNRRSAASQRRRQEIERLRYLAEVATDSSVAAEYTHRTDVLEEQARSERKQR